MLYTYLIPNWFFGFDIGMEILFAIVTCLVAVFALKIGNVTKEKRVKQFGIAFLLIGLSYVVLATLNYWFVTLAAGGFREIIIDEVQKIGFISLYLYMILFVSGLITLAYVTADMKKGKTYYLLFGLAMLTLVVSLNKLMTFKILSIFLLSFIAYQYLDNYLQHKNKREFLTVIAFSILLLSNAGSLFVSYYYQAYIIAKILELVAYLVILVILVKSVKK